MSRVGAGTENVAGIVGFGEACYLAERGWRPIKRLTVLRDRLIKGILDRIPDTVLNGHPSSGSSQRQCKHQVR